MTSSKGTAVRSKRSQKRDADGARLGTAGRKLFEWGEKNFNSGGVEPLFLQLCQLEDRLAAVRCELKKGVDGRLIGAETKLVAQYGRLWKLLGLSDDPKKANRPGRPAGVPAAPRKSTGMGLVS